jgi:hypothetical protein
VPAQYTVVSREVASAPHQTKGGRAFPVRFSSACRREVGRCGWFFTSKRNAVGAVEPWPLVPPRNSQDQKRALARPAHGQFHAVLDGLVSQTPDRCRFFCLDSNGHCQSLRIQERARTVQLSCESGTDEDAIKAAIAEAIARNLGRNKSRVIVVVSQWCSGQVI